MWVAQSEAKSEKCYINLIGINSNRNIFSELRRQLGITMESRRYWIPTIENPPLEEGSQFTSNLFTEKVLNTEIKLSMDGKGRVTDNVMIERFWRSIKYEKIYINVYENNIDLYLGITEYVHFYNFERKHQSLEYRTPAALYGASKKLLTNSHLLTKRKKEAKEAKKAKLYSNNSFNFNFENPIKKSPFTV